MLINLKMPPGMGSNGMPIGMNPMGSSGKGSAAAKKAMAAGAAAMKNA